MNTKLIPIMPSPERILDALLFSLWVGFVILAAIWIVGLVFGRMESRHKALLYFSGLLLSLLSIPVGLNLHRIDLLPPVFPQTETGMAAKVSDSSIALTGENSASSATVSSYTGRRSNVLAQWLAGAYGFGVVLMTLRLFFGLSISRKLAASCENLPGTELLKSFREVKKRMKISSPVIPGVSELISSPLVVGILRPVVLLPVASLNHMTTEQLEMIFAHELAHIKRNDHRLIFLQRLAETMLFFHPAVWTLSRWLDREREHACDDIVVSTGASRADYAETLVAVSRMNPDPAGLLQLAAASDVSSELAKRVHRLLQISPPLRFSRGSFSLAVAIVLSLWFLLAPSDQIVASDKEPAKAEVTELEILKKRVRELEALTDPVLKRKAAEQTLRKNRDKAAARAEMDREKYARKEFLEIEARYRKAVNGTLEELEEFVSAFPGSNRTGCAVLLLGRRSQSDPDKEKWFKEAMENYSDCYYPDGVQVGPYARFFLAHLYQAQGKNKQAGKIFGEVKDGFPDAVSHERTLLKVMISELADRPKVVAASPDNGDRTVSPDTKEIRIEFDRPMDPAGFSFVGGGSNYPEITGRPRWIDSKTVVLPVTLRHSHDYFLSINSDSSKNFRSEQGFQAVSYPIRFKTAATP